MCASCCANLASSRRTRATFVSAAVKAVVKFKRVQSVVNYSFDHFPDGLK